MATAMPVVVAFELRAKIHAYESQKEQTRRTVSISGFLAIVLAV
jgi:hypothetical protein